MFVRRIYAPKLRSTPRYNFHRGQPVYLNSDPRGGRGTENVRITSLTQTFVSVRNSGLLPSRELLNSGNPRWCSARNAYTVSLRNYFSGCLNYFGRTREITKRGYPWIDRSAEVNGSETRIPGSAILYVSQWTGRKVASPMRFQRLAVVGWKDHS